MTKQYNQDSAEYHCDVRPNQRYRGTRTTTKTVIPKFGGVQLRNSDSPLLPHNLTRCRSKNNYKYVDLTLTPNTVSCSLETENSLILYFLVPILRELLNMPYDLKGRNVLVTGGSAYVSRTL